MFLLYALWRNHIPATKKMIDKCLKCLKRILSHSKIISCIHCSNACHLNCISVNHFEMSSLVNDTSWICPNCISDAMPFVHIDDDIEFILSFSYRDHFEIIWEEISDKLFNPFSYNDNCIDSPLDEYDPDQNFYSDLAVHSNTICKYFTELSFNELISEKSIRSDHNFSMLHANARSLPHNFKFITDYLACLDLIFNFIGITETWLSDSNYDLYNMDGYNFYDNHRSLRSGGGVGLYTRENIEYLERKDLEINNEFIESVFIEVPVCNLLSSKKVLIGVVYRPPGTSIKDFNDILNTILDKIGKNICYLMGDWNMNLLSYDTHKYTTNCIDTLYSYGYSPLINRPTRITATTATIIDNIFTNNHATLIDSCHGILVTDISDHFPIFHIDTTCDSTIQEIFITKRSFSEENKAMYLKKLAEFDWNAIYRNQDAQSAFTQFHSKIKAIFDQCFPFKEIKIRYNKRKAPINDELRNMIKYKNRLFYNYLKCRSSYNEQIYVSHRNKVNRLLEKNEKDHIASLLEANKGNIKKTWKIIKNVINRKRQNKIQTRFKLDTNNITTDNTTIAEKFNDFYVNVGPNLASKIPPQNITPEHYLGDRLIHELLITEVETKEYEEILASLKQCSPGYDGFNKDILFLSLPNIGILLLYLLNLSLSQGVFPDELKIANVIPLFKADDPMRFNNYRPVSLLSIFSKIYERAMCTRLTDFLEFHKILYEKQFGFRKQHSAYMAHMLLVDNLIKALQNEEFVIGVFLDFSKAFDTVDHSILLLKLQHYGIRGISLKWFESYLDNRKQYVTYNGTKSDMQRVKCGVPQGSILGPILFLIYINDLIVSCKHSVPFLFADDTNLFTSGKNLNYIARQMNDELASICIWLKVNKLSLNVKKTHFMVFNPKNRPCDKIQLNIDGTLIDEEQHTKFLGVYIDNKLTWKKHIEVITGKISRGIGVIWKAKKLLNKSALKTVYYSFIYPYLTYCNQVWGSTCTTYLKGLRVKQNKVISMITSSPRRTRLDPLYKKLGLLKLDEINTFLFSKFMYRWHHNKVPAMFIDCFPHIRDVHDHDTRQSARNELYFSGFKTPLSQRRFMYMAPFIWNNILRNNINVEMSEYCFTKTIKHSIKVGLL